MTSDWPYPTALFPKAPVRADDLRFVLDQIKYGHHCAVLGASNTGKSSLLNSLTTPLASQLLAKRIVPPSSQIDPTIEFKENNVSLVAQPGSTADLYTQDLPFLVVFVDCLEAGDSEQALYEVIVRRVVDEFNFAAQDTPSETNSSHQMTTLSKAEMVEIHRSVLESSTELAFRSAFASGLRRLLHDAQCRLLLVLDEFDDIFRSLPPWPFRQLRAAANQHGGQIQYVVATSHRLAYLRQDPETYEFREIFQMATRSLMPLSADDSVQLMGYLDTQEPTPPLPKLMETIVAVTGGHPGLLERIHALVSQQAVAIAEQISAPKLVEILLQSLPIRTECERLWDELEEAEQDAVRAVLNAESNAETAKVTAVKGLHKVDDPARLFSPLLTECLNLYVNQQPSSTPQSEPRGIFCDAATEQIWADGKDITWTLASEHQRSLVRLLHRRGGAVASYDEIADHVYGVGEGVSPAAIRELVNRTRKKLPDSGYIINVPGEGYRLRV